MIPPGYANFFMTMAGVEASLFGLIFIVISIAPGNPISSTSPLEHQINVLTAYSALLNPLIIALFALIPQQSIGIAAIVVSIEGLANSLGMLLTVLRTSVKQRERIRTGVYMLIGCVLFGFEAWSAVRIFRTPSDLGALNSLANVLIIITFFGVARAWDLVGIRRANLPGFLPPIPLDRNMTGDRTAGQDDSGAPPFDLPFFGRK